MSYLKRWNVLANTMCYFKLIELPGKKKKKKDLTIKTFYDVYLTSIDIPP